MQKEQFIQNCLQDHYVVEENDLSVEKAEMFFEANYPCLTTSKTLLLPQTGMVYGFFLMLLGYRKDIYFE